MDNKYFRFGKSLACVQLVIELEKLPRKDSRKISTHIEEFCRGLNQLSSVDKFCRHRMGTMWLDQFTNHDLTIPKRLDFNYDTTLKNILKYRYRLWLEENNLLNKYELADRQEKNIRESLNAERWIAENIS